jgi:hypothetical protein
LLSAEWRPLAADGLAPFPKAIILDTDVFSPLPRGPGTYEISGKTPCSVLEAINYDQQGLVDQYFAGAHRWCPMLSKKRLAQRLANSHTEFEPAVALLLVCMRLLAQAPPSRGPPDTPLYHLTKQYAASIETSGSITLSLVQGTLLIAMYELGHGLHPAGYLSISRAARFGYLLGLHDKDNAVQMFKAPDTWTLCEEERRTWWTIFILDR